MFPRHMSLLEVRMSCRLVSSSMFLCYPCLGFCLWCCISVQGRYSFQRSRFECCRHTLVCLFPSSPLSSTCSSSDIDFHFHQLIHVAFVVAHVVY